MHPVGKTYPVRSRFSRHHRKAELWADRLFLRRVAGWDESRVKQAKMFARQWAYLCRLCSDAASRERLETLKRQFDQQKWGVSHAAQAEVELAELFAKAGYSLAFLPESSQPTADLECYAEGHRVFAEATVIMPKVGEMWKAKRGSLQNLSSGSDVQVDEQVLAKRIVARMQEKARQFSHYCAPVILSITIPEHPAPQEGSSLLVDVGWLSGMMTMTLASMRQLSAVLLTLWDIQPRETRAAIRFRHVYCVERAGGSLRTSRDMPRIRLFIQNPSAIYPLEDTQSRALHPVL
ncbi:MAG: hypothetical protein D6704_06825 [Nitrospirae bacterium]|nr:MAG: hypothetical protein D6704_06825 [Nitrospirota bacterium]